jgi:hypothetical protein
MYFQGSNESFLGIFKLQSTERCGFSFLKSREALFFELRFKLKMGLQDFDPVQKRGRICRPDGLSLPVIIHDNGGDDDILEYQTVELSIGPNGDSDIYIIDPSKVELNPIGKSQDGFQKVQVDDGKYTRELYLPLPPKT